MASIEQIQNYVKYFEDLGFTILIHLSGNAEHFNDGLKNYDIVINFGYHQNNPITDGIIKHFMNKFLFSNFAIVIEADYMSVGFK